MNVVPVLKKLGIDPKMSVHRAIYDVSCRVNNSSNRLRESNMIIESFGAPKIKKDERIAELIAKGIVEYAFQHPTDFVVDKAVEAAKGKYEKLLSRYPYIFQEPKEKPSSYVRKDPTRASRKNNDKKAQAEQLFNENKQLSNGELAKLISKQLEITYANAYYYVSRVFTR